ncbi:MAG: TonB-dependent receptor, partial [Gemmatimonadetes bacterium]|nr:TonB-dependent receptor [Gemmatimonadota bacterium]NIQ53500.1 TonB-dependent receptor [Gemmatimonadota bacterium]NIU73642.1 TonB-dependent receptor [Gammaproteobacteria bacterium]NIX43823.1 TonB-dependent receptor [Gemmatimonadota bacterium]NIY08024.1 TonB-dependent receptor [Gemmatimonadota bacterium]
MRGGLAVLALLAAVPAAAQAPPDTLRQDTVYEIEPIAVRAVRPSATTGGVSAIVVRLDSVRFRPAPLLEDVLRELPLVQVRTNSRGEAQLALRGAEERQIAVLLDGIPVTLGWDHRTDLSIIPMTAAQSIQLVRGMSSVLHGPNVLGGVVQVGLGTEPRGRVRPIRVAAGVDDAGGYSIGVVGAADGRGDEDRWVIRAGVGRRQRDGFESARDVESVYPALRGSSLRVNSDLDHTDGFLSARYQGEGGGWISATTSGFRAERGVPPELNDDGPRLWRYPETWRFLSVVSAGLGGMQSDRGLEVNVGVDVGGTRIQDFAAPAQPDDPALPATAFYRTVAETEESDDRTITLRLKGTQRIAGGLEVRGAATYADVRHDEVIRVGLDTTAPTSYPGGYRQRLWSVGTEADLPFRLGGLGPFTGGRVSTGFALDGADTPEAGGAVAGPSMTEWGGRLGVSTSTRGGGLLIHTAVSRRGRFPALREMYSTALGRFEPNPELRPEILTAIEAGFTSRFGDYDLQVVGFHQRLDDAIVRGAPPSGSTARYQRLNRDQVRSTGLEVMAGYTLGRVAFETEFTVQDVEVVEPG